MVLGKVLVNYFFDGNKKGYSVGDVVNVVDDWPDLDVFVINGGKDADVIPRDFIKFLEQ